MRDNRQYIKQIKLIFLHIPKTGGSFVEKILQKIFCPILKFHGCKIDKK